MVDIYSLQRYNIGRNPYPEVIFVAIASWLVYILIAIAIILALVVVLAILAGAVALVLFLVFKKKPSDKALPREIPENYDAEVVDENPTQIAE